MIQVFDEKGKKLEVSSLDFEQGALHKIGEAKFVYKPFSERELKLKEISKLKEQLAESEEQAIKFADEEISAEEYAPIKAERQALRAEINRLEKSLKN